MIELIDLTREFYDIKRAVAHLEIGLKAYRAATRDEIDATRLLDSIDQEVAKLVSSAEEAREKIRLGLAEPVTAEG